MADQNASAVAEQSPTICWDYVQEPQPTTFDYFTNRYFHQYIFRNLKKMEGNNVRLLQHSNGICVVCLDPTHAAIAGVRSGSTSIRSIAYGTGRNSITPESIQVCGKRKKNALICQTDMRFCTITMEDETVYPIPACLNGFVLELNAALLEHHELAVHAPLTEGYLAVINPSAKTDLSTSEKVWTATGGDVGLDEND